MTWPHENDSNSQSNENRIGGQVGRSDSNGIVDDYDANAAAQFSALNSVTPPDIWSRVAPQPVSSVSELNETMAMGQPASIPLLGSDSHSLSTPGPMSVVVSRRPFSELVPSGRQLVSVAAVLIFAVVAVAGVLSVTRQDDATIADGGGVATATELASGTDEVANETAADDSAKSGQLASSVDDLVTKASEGNAPGRNDSSVVGDDETTTTDAPTSTTKVKATLAQSASTTAANNQGNEPGTRPTQSATSRSTTSAPTSAEPATTKPTTTEPARTKPSATKRSVTTRRPTTRRPTTNRSTTERPADTTMPTTPKPETPDGKVISINGIFTESMIDCTSHTKLDRKGNSVTDRGLTCDGGSWIVVGGVRIRTSSGKYAAVAPQGNQYNRHPEDALGTTLKGSAWKGENGFADLSCDKCGLSAVRESVPTVTTAVVEEIDQTGSRCTEDLITRPESNVERAPLRPDCSTVSWMIVNGIRVGTSTDVNGLVIEQKN